MSTIFQEGPIIACSTGMTSNSAISVIRLSGFDSLSDLNRCFSSDISSLKARYASLTSIVDGDKELDQVVITFYKAPHSYTGENVLEIAAHGNLINVKRIIDFFIDKAGVKHALPGEFSFRAYQNKKLTLSQVEGLDLLLSANSGLILDQGIAALQGELHGKYLELQKTFLTLKSSIELSIDFLEDVGEEQAEKSKQDSFKHIKTLITELHSRSQGNYASLTTPSIVLVGKTNAGKSSLFNLLLEQNRSIVSSEEGTTRDYVTEYVFKDGINFKLVDTAGLRTSSDSIENEGMNRTREQLANAFFRILVVNPMDWSEDEAITLSDIDFDLIVFTHADKNEFSNALSCHHNLPKFKGILPISLTSGSIEPVKLPEFGPIEPISKSALENLGYGSMGAEKTNGPIGPRVALCVISHILEMAACKYMKLGESNPILIDRHRQVISTIYAKTMQLQDVIASETDSAIISAEVDALGASIQDLVGIILPDDVLNNIFENFCIGK